MFQFALKLLIGLLIIDLAVIIHELGHYLAARALEVGVETLSLGIGPKLLSRMSGCTEYRLSLIPLGGYCRLQGSVDYLRPGAHSEAAPPLRRLSVYLSGPLMNLLIAFLLFLLASALPVERLSDPCYMTPASEYPSLFPEGAKQEGVRKGDLALSSGSYAFKDFQDFEYFLSLQKGKAVPLTVLRDGEITETVLIAEDGKYGLTRLRKPVVGRSESGLFLPGDVIVSLNGHAVEWDLDVYQLDEDELELVILRDGSLIQVRTSSLPFSWESGERKARDPGNPFASALKKLVSAFKAFSREDAAGGPVRTAESLGSIASLGFGTSFSSGLRSISSLLAMISLSLAALNLLPLPLLDGGEALLCAFERIKGKALQPGPALALRAAGIIALALIILAAL